VIADRAGHQNLIAGLHGSGRTLHTRIDQTDAGGGDVHPVGLSVLHHLGVAADDADAGASRACGNGTHLAGEHGRWQSGFEHERDEQRRRHGSRHRQVVHRAVHGELADRSTRKPQRPDDETVGGKGEPSAVDREKRGIRERPGGVTEERHDQPLEEPAAGPPSGAVRHLDLEILEPGRGDDGRHGCRGAAGCRCAWL
jgi:hypothetical protein